MKIVDTIVVYSQILIIIPDVCTHQLSLVHSERIILCTEPLGPTIILEADLYPES